MMPVEVQLLRLGALARTCADAPATDVMTPTQLIVLRVVCKQTLPAHSTLRDALAVAAQGGHIKNNGERAGSFSGEACTTSSCTNKDFSPRRRRSAPINHEP